LHSVEELAEKWLETGDDAVLDVLKAGDEDFIQRAFAPRPGFKEGYCSRAEYFEAYFRWRIDGAEWQQYRLRAIAEGHLPEDDRAQFVANHIAFSGGDFKEAHARIARDDSKGTMFVSVAERIQDIQGIVFRPIPSKVWLEIVDDPPGVCRNALEDFVGLLDVLVGVYTDGETPPRTRRIGLHGSDQSANQVVECGTEVVQELSDRNARVECQLAGAVNPVDHPGFVCVRICFENELVFCGFDKSAGVVVDSVQMTMRPFDATVDGF
jgi:hypothetical protein